MNCDLHSSIDCRPGVGNLRPASRMQPAEAFYPPRDLLLSSGPLPFLFFNEEYEAINRQNDFHLLAKTCLVVFAPDSSEKRPEFLTKTFFLVFAINRPKKGLNFWRRPSSFGPLVWWRPARTLLGLNVAH